MVMRELTMKQYIGIGVVVAVLLTFGASVSGNLYFSLPVIGAAMLGGGWLYFTANRDLKYIQAKYFNSMPNNDFQQQYKGF